MYKVVDLQQFQLITKFRLISSTAFLIPLLRNLTSLQVYIEDALNERWWVECAWCKCLVENIVTAFGTKQPPSHLIPTDNTLGKLQLASFARVKFDKLTYSSRAVTRAFGLGL